MALADYCVNSPAMKGAIYSYFIQAVWEHFVAVWSQIDGAEDWEYVQRALLLSAPSSFLVFTSNIPTTGNKNPLLFLLRTVGAEIREDKKASAAVKP